MCVQRVVSLGVEPAAVNIEPGTVVLCPGLGSVAFMVGVFKDVVSFVGWS